MAITILQVASRLRRRGGGWEHEREVYVQREADRGKARREACLREKLEEAQDAVECLKRTEKECASFHECREASIFPNGRK